MMRKRTVFTRVSNLAFTIMLTFTMVASGFGLAKKEVNAEQHIEGVFLELTIKKETVDNKEGEFSFSIKIETENDSFDPFLIIWKGDIWDVVRLDTYDFKLKNGESLTVRLPEGVKYEITESAQSGWELVSIDGDTSKTKADGTTSTSAKTVTFLNKVEEDNPKIEEPITEEPTTEKPKEEGTTVDKTTTVTPTDNAEEEIVVISTDKDDEKEKSSKTVKTGDADNITPWLVILLASAASLVAMGYRLRQSR